MIFSNLRPRRDLFAVYPQLNVFTTTCGSLSESKPEPHLTTRHMILSLADNYLCYMGPKSPYNFFLFWYLTNYLRLKLRTNGNVERRGPLLWNGSKSNCCLRIQTDPFAFSTVLSRLSDQKISMKCYLILRKLRRKRKLKKNNITSLKDKATDVNVFALSLTI